LSAETHSTPLYQTPANRLVLSTETELCAKAQALHGLASTATTSAVQQALERLSARYLRLAAARSERPEPGERIIVKGRVTDASGRPVPDVSLEIWQANAVGRYSNPDHSIDAPLDRNFSGHAVIRTNEDGRYSFITIRPGAYPDPGDSRLLRPSHIHFVLSGPGFARKLFTEMYFPTGASTGRNRQLSLSERLIASSEDSRPWSATPTYRFDLVLGDTPNATPFSAIGRHPWLLP
jgi:protocatechuate 3,4-dioxygenase beta subunit